MSTEGWILLFSQLETLCFVTPSSRAISTWLMFLAQRSSRILALSIITSKYLYCNTIVYKYLTK